MAKASARVEGKRLDGLGWCADPVVVPREPVSRWTMARTPFTATTISTAQTMARPTHTHQRPPPPRQLRVRPLRTVTESSGAPTGALPPCLVGCGPRSSVDLRAIPPPSRVGPFVCPSGDFTLSPGLRPRLALTYTDGSHAEGPAVS